MVVIFVEQKGTPAVLMAYERSKKDWSTFARRPRFSAAAQRHNLQQLTYVRGWPRGAVVSLLKV
jgi:hypothetical protein